MSQMQELYKKVLTDITLQEKLSGVIKDAEKAGEDAIGRKLIAFAKDAGYDVTIDDMKEFFNETAKLKDGALSDSDLEMVAGGSSIDCSSFRRILQNTKIRF